jgi:hypothetical protein
MPQAIWQATPRQCPEIIRVTLVIRATNQDIWFITTIIRVIRMSIRNIRFTSVNIRVISVNSVVIRVTRVHSVVIRVISVNSVVIRVISQGYLYVSDY